MTEIAFLPSDQTTALEAVGPYAAGEAEARAIQLEYDPLPPFDSGAIEHAGPELRQRATPETEAAA